MGAQAEPVFLPEACVSEVGPVPAFSGKPRIFVALLAGLALFAAGCGSGIHDEPDPTAIGLSDSTIEPATRTPLPIVALTEALQPGEPQSDVIGWEPGLFFRGPQPDEPQSDTYMMGGAPIWVPFEVSGFRGYLQTSWSGVVVTPEGEVEVVDGFEPPEQGVREDARAISAEFEQRSEPVLHVQLGDGKNSFTVLPCLASPDLSLPRIGRVGPVTSSALLRQQEMLPVYREPGGMPAELYEALVEDGTCTRLVRLTLDPTPGTISSFLFDQWLDAVSFLLFNLEAPGDSAGTPPEAASIIPGATPTVPTAD